MTSAMVKVSGILMFVALCAADDSIEALSQSCMDCICQAASGCKPDLGCEGDVCGVYRITEGYWNDAGNITVSGVDSASTQEYMNCANDASCAARTVRGYMKLYAQDCNGDGEVNCRDFMAIHTLGGFGCTGELPPQYERDFYQCFSG